MSDLLLHRGAIAVPFEVLKTVQIPEATHSYMPVAHHNLASSLKTISQDILTDYALVGEQYAIARQGNQLFAVLNFKSDHSEMGLAIGFRNSYDKSMSIGIAIGARVFVCDNLALTGDIAVMKKHSANVLNVLEDTAITTLYKAQYTFTGLIKDSEQMKACALTDDEAFKQIGLLFGHEVLSPRQIPLVREQWLKPKYQDFQDRNLWSLYNGVTESLKGSPPLTVMERHIKAHKLLTGGAL